MTSFSEDMRRRGMVPGSRTLSMTSTLAGARLGRFLQVSPSEKILVIKRLRLADGETMAIETLHLPDALFPGLTAKDLSGSFYDLLSDRYGIAIASGTQAIEPTVTNEEESAALGVPLGVVGATASASSGRGQANKLTVWLQVDAQNGWPDIVAAATQQFQQQNPGWTVNVQYQQWTDHLQKFDATIAGSDTPDVIEMGNTEMTKYMAAGAFSDLTASKSKIENSGTWLAGLAKSGMYGGKVYGVPYYAGSRVITYRTDLFKKAGISKPPTSLAQFQADLVKVGQTQKNVKGFSPLYVGGEDWYTALSFVFDYGG